MCKLGLLHSIVLPDVSGKTSHASGWLFLRYYLILICISFSLWNLRRRSPQGACFIRLSWVLVALIAGTRYNLHGSSRTFATQRKIIIKIFDLLNICPSLWLRFCSWNLFRVNISRFLLVRMILTKRLLLILKSRLVYLILIKLSLSCKWGSFILEYWCLVGNFSSSFWTGFFPIFFQNSSLIITCKRRISHIRTMISWPVCRCITFSRNTSTFNFTAFSWKLSVSCFF